MTDKVRVVAESWARPGQEEALRAVLQAAVAPTEAEAGCLEYRLHEDLAQPGHFVFVEEWESAETLAAHGRTAHIAALRAGAAPLLAKPMVVTKLRAVG
ncbi:antibiotic biosynthesis monooxygenase [Roseomonas sp. OT10]|uniref:putative quinol monooxygenase n=1 Tax=Roseomonas cutis TaxID=2897332 RepID=UPI001E383361|nr:putative quinol monooxygenase [Roseomonas sp. OT10]UFN46819.1 antibiotic biosynthesis monooxygenase [Roseomonas sp. OT10]